MSVLAGFILIIVSSLIVLWYWKLINKNREIYKRIPGPPTLPFLGNALYFTSTIGLLDTLMEFTKKYGEIVKLRIGPVRTFFVTSDYKLLEHVLSSTTFLTKSDDYNFFWTWLGTGLLTSDGLKWKQHRKVLTPTFHFQILEQFIDIFETCGEKLVRKLEKQIGNSATDIYPYVTLFALDVICESTMGVSVDAQDDSNSEYVKSVKNMGRIVIERSLSPLQMYDILYPLTRNYYTERKALKILHGYSNNVINKRREELKYKNIDCKDADDDGFKKKKPFLDVLLEANINGDPLTNEEIREEVDTFMFEGHDTTASGISFSLFCLANNPDIQAKAFQEQEEIFKERKTAGAKYADLQNMKYLEQVIKESLRLYPSVPIYGRRIANDIKCGNIHLPEGDTFVIFAYGIHRNPKYFKNPDEFNPDRFKETDGKLPYAYIPFSAGPRNCIGQKFAMLEMKSTISKILRKFELEPACPKHELKLSAETVMKSVNGVHISLKLRN